MNRRGFLKTCGGGVATALTPLLLNPPSLLAQSSVVGNAADLSRDGSALFVAARDGMSIINFEAFGDFSRIVSMAVFEDTVFILTEHMVYRIRRDAEHWTLSRVCARSEKR